MFRLIATCFLLCSQAVSALYNQGGPVVILTKENWQQEVIKGDSLWLIEFYAPWCGHCKNLAPEWTKAAKQLKGVVKVGAVDMTEHQEVGAPYNVQGFPTLKFFGFDKKNPVAYESGRDADSIVKFALDKVKSEVNGRGKGGKSSSSSGSGGSGNGGKKADGSDVLALTDSTFDSTIYGSKDIWMVEFYAPWCGHCKALEPEWNQAAADLKGKVRFAKVGATENESLARRFGVQGYPTIKYFDYGKKSSPSDAKPFEGGRDAAAIKAFASDLLNKADIEPDLFELINQKVYDDNCKGTTICVISFLPNIYESNAAEPNSYIAMIKKVAGFSSFLWYFFKTSFYEVLSVFVLQINRDLWICRLDLLIQVFFSSFKVIW